ncbi:hypothetical protein M0R45_008694 [Rubus argutus]|uniref:Uncharacterized protein n=1 Tax=Rubus argutus TaxID=59490 RepID=A0AAW1Y1Z3_RUBAR
MALMTNNVDLLREFRNITPTADLQAFESELMIGAQGIINKIVAEGNPKVVLSLAACTLGVGAGSFRVLDAFNAYEAALLVHRNAINSMIKESNMIAIMELQDIERLINKIVREIDSLVFNVGFAAKGNVDFGMKDIKRKLDNFLKKIEDLETKTAESSSRIMREREEFRTTLNSKNSFTRGE